MNRKTVKHHFSLVSSPLFPTPDSLNSSLFQFHFKVQVIKFDCSITPSFLITIQRNSVEGNLQIFYKMTFVKFQKKQKSPYNNSDSQINTKTK